jgi:hypothetical protein
MRWSPSLEDFSLEPTGTILPRRGAVVRQESSGAAAAPPATDGDRQDDMETRCTAKVLGDGGQATLTITSPWRLVARRCWGRKASKFL